MLSGQRSSRRPVQFGSTPLASSRLGRTDLDRQLPELFQPDPTRGQPGQFRPNSTRFNFFVSFRPVLFHFGFDFFGSFWSGFLWFRLRSVLMFFFCLVGFFRFWFFISFCTVSIKLWFFYPWKSTSPDENETKKTKRIKTNQKNPTKMKQKSHDRTEMKPDKT